MKIKSILLLASLGIISATAVGATSASWAVTDSADSFVVKVSVAQTNRSIYFNAGGSSLWDQSGAWFAAYVCEGSPKESKFVTLNPCVEDGYYTFTLEPEYKKIVFSRQKPDSSVASWENQWNQTVDVNVSGSFDTYTITGWGDSSTDNKSTVAESKHTDCIAGEIVFENVVPADCENDGSHDEVKYCAICGKELSREHVVDEKHHNLPLTYHAAVAPTCTEDGNIAYYECEDCNKYYANSDGTGLLTPAEIIDPATGHDYDLTTWYQKSDGNGGYYHYHKCFICGAETDIEACHGGAATEASGAICEVCDHVYTDPLGHTHSYVHHDAVAATCTTDGNSEYYTCSGCDNIFDASKVEIGAIPTIPALGHNYVNHECSRCGDIESGWTKVTFNVTKDAGMGNYIVIVGTFNNWSLDSGYITLTCSGTKDWGGTAIWTNGYYEFKAIHICNGGTSKYWQSGDNNKESPSGGKVTYSWSPSFDY